MKYFGTATRRRFRRLYNLGESSGFTDAVVNFAMKTNPNNAKDKNRSIELPQSNNAGSAPQEHLELTSLVLSLVLKWDECSKSARVSPHRFDVIHGVMREISQHD